MIRRLRRRHLRLMVAVAAVAAFTIAAALAAREERPRQEIPSALLAP